MTSTGPSAQFFQKPETGFDAFDPAHTSPLVCWLASPAAANVSGNVFIVWGKEITVLGPPTKAATYHATEAWSVAEVGKHVGRHFEGKLPIKDSFIMPNNF